MRVATEDAYGAVLNAYTQHRRIGHSAPDRPWAVYLTGTDRRYRLLAFDFDAKTPGAAEAAAGDAETLARLLEEAGLRAVVCQSGPTGGRHVWAGLAETIDAETVATLARLARHLCPTLDLSALTNPATGCVRPPGAPHRSGGYSTVLSGDLAALTAPSGTAGQVRAVVEHLAGLIGATELAGTVDLNRPLPLDEHGHPYLPGPRRALPAVSAAALQEDAACGDASAVLWRVLIGAASARWRHAEIAALVDTSPGLEHVRTYRDRSERHHRTRAEAAAVLRRQWDKAVTHVATSARQVGEDPTFDARADALAAHVRALQTRADAAAGRWAHGGGPADRRVLDVLCTLTLQALSTTLEADTRRLALLAGIGRETARTALLRLADDGWITHARTAEGPHGAHWRIGPEADIHSHLGLSRSQADPRPAGAGAAERSTLLQTLTERVHAFAHDLFTPKGGLGHLAGNLYARTSDQPQSLSQLATTIGAAPILTTRLLDRLAHAGVLAHCPTGWHRPATDRRRQAARHRQVEGRLTERAVRYHLERELWAWWQAELSWMSAPRRTAPSRRPGPGQLVLFPEPGTNTYGAHPRRADGTADYRTARQHLEADAPGGDRPPRAPAEANRLRRAG